jgi:hypothetical protein
MKISYGSKMSNKYQWGCFAVKTEKLGFLDRLFVVISLLGIIIWSFPHLAWASTAKEMPLIFETNNLRLPGTQGDQLKQALAQNLGEKPETSDPRVEQLRNYLLSKNNSPLAQEAELLLQQYHFRLIIGISFAESNFCLYQIMPNNCWGIGGGRPERYQSLAEGITRANELIQKYRDQGMTTPKLMRDTWVGWRNHNWAIAVDQTAQELENLGL